MFSKFTEEILKQANKKYIANLNRCNKENFVIQLLEYYIEDVKDYCQQKIENYIVLNNFAIFEQNFIYDGVKYIVGNSYKQSDFNNCYDMFHEKISFGDITKLINNYMLLKDELSEPAEGIGENCRKCLKSDYFKYTTSYKNIASGSKLITKY